MLHGCIPVVIMDNVHAVLESALDWDSFALRINERSAEDLPQILKSLSPDRVSRVVAGCLRTVCSMHAGVHSQRTVTAQPTLCKHLHHVRCSECCRSLQRATAAQHIILMRLLTAAELVLDAC